MNILGKMRFVRPLEAQIRRSSSITRSKLVLGTLESQVRVCDVRNVLEMYSYSSRYSMKKRRFAYCPLEAPLKSHTKHALVTKVDQVVLLYENSCRHSICEIFIWKCLLVCFFFWINIIKSSTLRLMNSTFQWKDKEIFSYKCRIYNSNLLVRIYLDPFAFLNIVSDINNSKLNVIKTSK
jgi:hypothetical protein